MRQRALSVQIRLRSPGDDAALAALAAEAFGEYSDSAGAHTLGMARRPASVTLVATAADELVGIALVVPTSESLARLDAIAVSVGLRGTGLGRRLLASAEGEARRIGAARINLATADANVAALDLFLRSGYRIARRLPRYYARGQDAVEMEKLL